MSRLSLGALMMAAILCILAACAAPSNQSGAFAPSPVARGGAKQHVTLRIKIPRKSKTIAKHRGRYISPATTQMAINVQTGCPGNCQSVSPYPTTAPLTPTSNGCSSTLASTLCELALPLPPGNYTLALTTQDTSGSALSVAQSVPLQVAAGAANTINVALSGIPHSIVTGSIGQNAFIVSALDADNNVIVGAGAPTFTVASTGGVAVSIAQPVVTSPNVFQVFPHAAGSASLSVTAAYGGGVTDGCAQTGAQCTGSAMLSSTLNGSPMFVGNYADGTVDQYSPPYTSAPVATLNGVGYPAGLAVNGFGDLFVSSVLGTVAEYAPPYTGAPIFTISKSWVPYGIAIDSHDNLFVADNLGNVVLKFAPPYNGAPTTVASSGISGPFGIALDSSNNLYVANFSGDTVTKYASPSYGSVAATLNSVSSATGIAVDSNGNVLVSYNGTEIGESDPALDTFTPVISGLSIPGYIAFDVSNNLYVTNQAAGSVSKFDSSYGLVNANLIYGLNQPVAITIYNGYTAAISP